MPRAERPPRGSGNARLAAATLALAPALGVTYGAAVLARRALATGSAARRALERLQLHALLAGRTVDAEPLGTGKSNAVIAVRLTGGGAPATRLVIKRALPFGSLMAWGARRFGANYVYAATTSGAARIGREAAALRFLGAHGVPVPRCLAAAPEHRLIAIEWIDGAPAATALYAPDGEARAREVGALLAGVHGLGVTLADGHPGNMLVARATDRLVLFDLEFAECSGATPARRGFDLAYAAVLMPTADTRAGLLAGYGERSAEDRAAFGVAEQHLRKFGRLLDMERARWAPRRG